MKKFYCPIRIFITLLAVLLAGCTTFNESDPANYGNMFQKTVQQAGGKVFPALVYIKVLQEDLGSGRSSKGSSSGSGVLISSDGEVVTNNHVVEKAVSIRCLTNDGRAFDAKLVGRDKDTDLALLKLELPANSAPLPKAEFAAAAPAEGEFVMALGAPWGLNRSISIGIISCAKRYLPGRSLYSLWHQSDAAISPGNSGGPLINTAGKIVGINTLAIFAGGALAFTIPAETVQIVLDRLRKYGKANWAWFGLHFQPLNDFDRNIYQPYTHGVLIAGTEAGSPAARSGFQADDLLLAINDQPITVRTAEDLPEVYRMLGLMEFNKKVRFTIQREGIKKDIYCAPTEKGKVEGDAVACDNWGFTAKAINRFDNPELYFYQPQGVFVFGVKKFSPAARAGLLKGDIIVKIDDRSIKTLDELLKCYKFAARTSQHNRRSRLTILRNGATLLVPVNFSKR